MNCLYCGEELPVSALRVPNSYATRKKMHRECARKARLLAERLDGKNRKATRKSQRGSE